MVLAAAEYLKINIPLPPSGSHRQFAVWRLLRKITQPNAYRSYSGEGLGCIRKSCALYLFFTPIKF